MAVVTPNKGNLSYEAVEERLVTAMKDRANIVYIEKDASIDYLKKVMALSKKSKEISPDSNYTVSFRNEAPVKDSPVVFISAKDKEKECGPITDKVIKVDVVEEIDRYFDESSLPKNGPPKFILITGGTGAGKTTLRKKDYSKGYVLLDAGDVFKNICKGKDIDYRFGDDFKLAMEAIGENIAKRALKEKRNIVMEIIGTSFETSKVIIDTMLACGYKVEVKSVQCDDVMEAYERHKKGAMEFVSAHFSQEFHSLWLLKAAKELSKP